MGVQQDGLRGLTRFSDNEGDIIWPLAWLDLGSSNGDEILDGSERVQDHPKARQRSTAKHVPAQRCLEA